MGRAGIGLGVFDPSAKGYLLITWQPEEPAPDVLASLDAVIALGSPHPDPHLVELTAGRWRTRHALRSPNSSKGRPAGPCSPGDNTPASRCRSKLGPRSTPHLHHEHKYEQIGVEPAQRFYFRTEPDTPTGAIATNLAELEAELASTDEGGVVPPLPPVRLL